MKENLLVENSKDFAVAIVNLCENVKGKTVLINQLIRSGTSIGANIREAQYAHGKRDFVFKLEIALKECYETEYWLELLFETKAINENIFKDFQQKAGVIRRMLIASCKTAKNSEKE